MVDSISPIGCSWRGERGTQQIHTMAITHVMATIATILLASCIVLAAPPAPSSSSAAMHTVLDRLAEAIAHPQHSPALHLMDPEIHEGSLHSATRAQMDNAANRRSSAAAGVGQHQINPRNLAKADKFVKRLDSLVAGLKAKSHLALLSNKYPGSRSATENATLAHIAAEAERDETQAELIEHEMEEDEYGQMHASDAQPIHSPAGSPEAHIHAQVERGTKGHQQAAAKAHIPHTTHSNLQSIHIADHDTPSHPILDPVPPRRHNPKRKVPRKRFLSEDQGYVLHPIQLPPTEPSPSGLNFTTFIYPTVEGNVTIFVGITEFPLGKFHIYPSPRDEMDEISLLSAKKMYQQQQQKARMSLIRQPIFATFLEMNAKLNPLCDGVATTSVSAQAYNCLLAQNAGFFNMQTDGCMGNVVSNDQFINHAQPNLVGHSHFGLTRKGNFITGYMTEEEVAQGVDGGFHELIQGSGWLIREGQNFINESAIKEGIGSGFVNEKAPRNAIGHDTYGRLLMFEADGEEDIKLGLTLIEFADILQHHFHVENAINVDGGGSSTTVYQGEVADKPTCRDTPQICERAVTTISCVLP